MGESEQSSNEAKSVASALHSEEEESKPEMDNKEARGPAP